MADRPELILKLTHTVAALPPADPLPLRMCIAFVRILGARAGTISLGYASTERTVLCATDETASRYEDAQDLVREGPSLDAFRAGIVVTCSSVSEHVVRWPALSAAAPALGGPVHAVPIQPDGSTMGVLTVHDGGELQLAADDAELRFLANAVGAAVLGELPGHDDQSRFWSERDRVSQATGMVIAQLRTSPGDALALLRAHAFAHDLSVVEVSRRVVARELDFSGTDRGEHK